MTFAGVGIICLGVQCGILATLEAVGVRPFVANAIGFVVSAQVNFVISSGLTWRDRPARDRRDARRRWASYQATVAGSLLVNAAVFAVFAPVVGSVGGAVVAVGVGALVTFAANHFLVFRRRTGEPAMAERLEATV